MNSRGDRIVIAGLEIIARHGVHPHEKLEPQRFEVDIELELDLAPAARADDLRLTVDYGAVVERLRTVLEGPSVDLVETLAERTAAAILDAFATVDAVVVRVRKPEVELALPLVSAGVEIRRGRR